MSRDALIYISCWSRKGSFMLLWCAQWQRSELESGVFLFIWQADLAFCKITVRCLPERLRVRGYQGSMFAPGTHYMLCFVHNKSNKELCCIRIMTILISFYCRSWEQASARIWHHKHWEKPLRALAIASSTGKQHLSFILDDEWWLTLFRNFNSTSMACWCALCLYKVEL